MFDQRDYVISERKYEYSKVVSVFKHMRDNYSTKSSLSLELINRTLQDLEDNKGEGISPQTYNCIIRVLLSFVPEEIKNY
jgi:hypothetical protein